MAKAQNIPIATSDQHMLDLIDLLQEQGVIQYKKDFYDTVGVYKENIPNIKRGHQKFTATHIEKACKAYNINANWIFGFSEKVFREQAEIRFISQGAKAASTKSAGKQKRI